MKNKFTGERLETFIYNGNTINHLHRYALAKEICRDKVVLDIASGEGYGSNILSDQARYVYGIDIDKITIQKAKIKYEKNNLKFKIGSVSKIPLKDNSVDIVISFETLEHHDKHDEMMLEIKRVMKSHGMLLISTPDKYFYSDIRAYNNKYHIKELYKNEFVKLISEYFDSYDLYTQSYFNRSSLIIKDNHRDNFEFYSGDYTELKKVESYPNFLIALCTNHKLIVFKNSTFEGHQLIENKNFERKIEAIYKSNSYKIGSFLLSPFKFLKSIFSKYFK